MILLHSDYLYFKTKNGQTIPCSAELVTIELLGDAAEALDPQLIHNASSAVLYFFKNEKNQLWVSIAEFTVALKQVLTGFGLSVTTTEDTENPTLKTAESDLNELARQSGKGFELVFFNKLRQELQLKITSSPSLIRINGLRPCVKSLMGAKRWSLKCQNLNDQIVDYIRICLSRDYNQNDFSLVVC
ncbi:MAG TPA: hypothetical protein EYQ50_19355 [Verrucomicrobiales bacterium]|jgi:hypothetical protein|nr:hypothetical protein [Verrucomicrobiales bacterium]HIL70560.1 hypothetical protein [Verrucomicrobiota bacterium]